MKVIGVLCWYDESPTWLCATVASAAAICDHLVAVAGAYALFPGGSGSSGAAQHEAIAKTAEAVGLGLTLHVPNAKWTGNEVEKRSYSYRLAATIGCEEDWVLVLDADDVILQCPSTVRERLHDTDLMVGQVSHLERWDPHADPSVSSYAHVADVSSSPRVPIRKFFRLLPGLRCDVTHFHHVAYEGDHTLHLWGNGSWPEEPALDCTDMVIEHRTRLRARERARRQQAYYQTRDVAGIERA